MNRRDPRADAHFALKERAIRISLTELAGCTVTELRDARRWAAGAFPTAQMPAWLKRAVADGRAVHKAGRCKECGCTDLRACEGGCSWADLSHTLCSQCEDVDAYCAGGNPIRSSDP